MKLDRPIATAWRVLPGVAVLGWMLAAGQPIEPGGQEANANAAPVERRAEAPAGQRHRLHQVVSIGGDAVVRTNQVAEQVVVVRGSAVIEGDVDSDAVVVLGKARITGRVRGDLVVVLGEVELNGQVDGDVVLILTRGKLGPEARVRGGMVAVGTPPEVDPLAEIRGRPEIVSLGPIMRYLDWGKEYLVQGVFLLRPFPPRLGWVWVVTGLFLLFHLVIAAVFARPLQGCMEILREQPARSFLVGLLACVLVGPVSILLSFTMVATPLILLAFFAVCVFGRVAVYGATGVALGRGVGWAGMQAPVVAVLVGSVLFYLSYMIPVVGLAVYWLVVPWGVGAALIQMFEALRRERRPTFPGPTRPASLSPEAARAASGLMAGATGPATQAMVGVPGTPGVESGAGPHDAKQGVAPAVEPGVEPGTGFGEAEPARSAPGATAPPPLPRMAAPIVSLNEMDPVLAVRVGFWPRLGAALIDGLVVGFVNAITFGEVRSFWLLLGAYHLVMWAWKGTTLGGAVLGMRIVRLDGRRVDWSVSAVRMLGSLVSLLPLGFGFFWVVWDDQFQSWHDRIAGTTIVKVDHTKALI